MIKMRVLWTAWDRLRRRLLTPDRLVRRLLVLAIGGTIAVALAGVLLALELDVETGRSSLPYVRPVLELTTSVWFYVAVLAILLRGFLLYRDRRYARQAAEVTGYAVDDIRREKYEATSTDGSTRVLVSDEDSPDAIAERIDRALETGEDDEIELNPDAFDVDLEGDQELDVEDLEDDRAGPRRSLRERARDGAGAVIGLLESIKAVERRILSVAWYGVLPLLAGWLRDRRDRRDQDGAGDAPDQAELEHEGDQEADVDDLLPVPREEYLRDPWLEQWKLARLDLQTTLDLDEILWYVLVPAAAATGLLLLAVQIWVPLWMYPPILAAGLLVGILNYARIGLVRSRRLEALREEHDPIEFGELSVLVKEVEIPERTTYHAHVAGRQYAHDDREEFVEAVAFRAYERVNGIPVSPSVLEKQARQLETLKPDLHGFRDAEQKRIMEWLLERVASEDLGLVPKVALIEECIEHDVEERGIGPFSRTRGKGFDPDLVREGYRELVPAALVEEEIELEEVDDQGEPLSITAVRLRTDPLPPDYAAIRAQFSARFANYARSDPLYELPDVDDRLEEPRPFSGRFGAGGSV